MTPGAAPMTDPQLERRRRNNVRLAIAHLLLALAILGAFIWAQVHR